jgi:hypothetical protein
MKHTQFLLVALLVLALIPSTVQEENLVAGGRNNRNDRDSGHGRNDRNSRDNGHGGKDRDSNSESDSNSHVPIPPVIPPVVYPCFTTQECGNFKMTAWINRDAPSGTGDFETVADAVSLGGCAAPLWVECQTTTGINWWLTNETIEFGPAGCVCKNAAQADLVCNYNYQIRELCPN